eukprot:TRINITY_DN14908_c0_g1_i1.p1 TRINITY_DN14908_c0_g1~~TRINITY_DN14908_c0_g1_i1.p1  ORF type:complete len:153 (+),score=35.92 TRINITY_DN14908_c0_g1_i1:112-570(+)
MNNFDPSFFLSEDLQDEPEKRKSDEPEERKTKKMRRAPLEMTLKDMLPHITKPQKEAASELGVGASSLSKKWKSLTKGFFTPGHSPRWPAEQLKQLEQRRIDAKKDLDGGKICQCIYSIRLNAINEEEKCILFKEGSCVANREFTTITHNTH